MHLRLSMTKPYFIREVSTRNSQSYLGPLERECSNRSLLATPFTNCHPERSEGPASCRKLQILLGSDNKSAALDLIVDIFDNPLQRSRQRLTPPRPLQQAHSFR